MTDQQIIEAYWQRNESAIQESSEKYGRYCFTIAHHILRNQEDAEECVNDTWMKAWNSMPPGRPGNLKLFLARITRNLSLNKYRSQRTDKRGGGELELILDELGEILSAEEGTEEEYMAKVLGETVNQFLHSLPERQCNIFVRRYFYSESIPEISDRYQLSSHYITVILSRTRRKLKQYLNKEGFIL